MNENVLDLLHALVKTGRAVETRLDGNLTPVELSATRLWTLAALDRAEKPITVGDMACSMAFAKSNATQLVDALEKARLVRRMQDPQDRRCTRIELTERGRRRQGAAQVALQPLLARLEALFTPEEQANLAEYLDRLAKGVAEKEMNGE